MNTETTETAPDMIQQSDHRGATLKNDSVVTFTRQFNPLIKTIEPDVVKFGEKNYLTRQVVDKNQISSLKGGEVISLLEKNKPYALSSVYN